MSPARIEEEDDDPVTAEYDVYLTPSVGEQAQQIYVLQYPNRPRDRPYNNQFGLKPETMRVKPQSGYLEMDVQMNTRHNFNQYQALKWGDAVRMGRKLQQQNRGNGDAGETFNGDLPPPTYGLAAGLQAAGGAAGRRGGAGVVLKDSADRELDIQNDIASFDDAVAEKKVLRTQTLGGHIVNHSSAGEAGKPVYYVGAFRGKELHLSRVTGTVQMRPQFHHLDAEDHRNRSTGARDLAAATAAAAQSAPNAPADGAPGSSKAQPEKVRAVHQTYKSTFGANPRGELEEQVAAMKAALQTAAEEPWTVLNHVDEEDPVAYGKFDERLFLRDTEAAARLQTNVTSEQYLNTISPPKQKEEKKPTSPERRRKGRSSGGDEG